MQSLQSHPHTLKEHHFPDQIAQEINAARSYNNHILWAICIASTLASSTIFAGNDIPDENETGIDRLHAQISQNVILSANWLDSFFDDTHYVEEQNQSQLRLTLSAFSEKGESTDLNTKFDLRLVLPRFKNRMHLIISGETDELDTTYSDAEDLNRKFEGRDSENLSIGLAYYFQQSARHHLNLGGGIRFRSGSPVAYIEPRYRYATGLGNWNLRFVEKFGWFSDSGFESKAQLQLERALSEVYFFRTTAKLDWYEDEEGLYPELHFEIRRPLSNNRVLSFQWNNYFETKPDAILDSSVLTIRYRQRIWREWLWLEVAPQIAFPHDEDYSAVPGILLKIQANFYQ